MAIRIGVIPSVRAVSRRKQAVGGDSRVPQLVV